MEWKGKRVVIVGAARQGIALARFLVGQGADVVLTDMRSTHQLEAALDSLADLPIEWRLGGHSLRMLESADLLCLSGGVPSDIALVKEAKKRAIPISNDSQIFLEETPCKTIGITGSAGKTTTTMLVGRMLEAAGFFRKVWVGGNIGNPLITDVASMTADDRAVMELSSFQLEWMTRSPNVAAILNIAPNHIDRHVTMENYVAAKARILDFQSESDFLILNREDSPTWELTGRAQGKLISFGANKLPEDELGTIIRDDQIFLRDEHGEHAVLPLSAIELRGDHNLMNVLAACAISAAAGASTEAMRAGVRGFRGAPHRLEFVRTIHEVDWYNDSIATSPQRAEAAVRSFKRPLVLLIGGRDKGLPWEEFASLAGEHAQHVVLFGEAAKNLNAVFQAQAPSLPVRQAKDLSTAVKLAAGVAKPGSVVLLAPGCTSFDEFPDFEARGERFRHLVNEL
ncbi:MAG: UDP-N-acetylmuramoyl-L-alanine--D-glutamate ligase [Anaerolineales bacterium]